MRQRVPKLRDLEVEPLSELAWHRVETKLMAALDRAANTRTTASAPPARGLTISLLGGGLAVAAAVALAIGLGGGPRSATTTTTASSRVVTTATASAVSFGDVAMTVAPESAIRVDSSDDRGVLVVLERGRVELAVSPRKERPALVVEAGDVRVEVIGTWFAVSREGAGASVEVFEGVVHLTAPGAASDVAAGERWPVVIEARAPTPGEVRAATPAASAPSSHRRVRAPTPAIARAPSAKERYEEAARLEASDAAAARAIYRELSAGKDAWAANALFALARLEEDVGAPGRAISLLEAYLRRFPAGANAGDARGLLTRLRSAP